MLNFYITKYLGIFFTLRLILSGNFTTLRIKSSQIGQSIIGENEMERFSILKMMAIWHMMHISSSSSYVQKRYRVTLNATNTL